MNLLYQSVELSFDKLNHCQYHEEINKKIMFRVDNQMEENIKTNISEEARFLNKKLIISKII